MERKWRTLLEDFYRVALSASEFPFLTGCRLIPLSLSLALSLSFSFRTTLYVRGTRT